MMTTEDGMGKIRVIESCMTCSFCFTESNGFKNFSKCTHPDLTGNPTIAITCLIEPPKTFLAGCPLDDAVDSEESLCKKCHWFECPMHEAEFHGRVSRCRWFLA